ncbi:MAG: peptidoglycan-binding protein [Wenzhouxiangella sp.]|nr:MAG: peptidoglycan-binding protein [Wenzhouxiangella sp.]
MAKGLAKPRPERCRARQIGAYGWMRVLMRWIWILLACCAPWVQGAALADGELRERLRHRLETLYQPGELVAGGQVLMAATPLRTLYEQRGWEPIWFGPDALPTAIQSQLGDAIALAARHGLEPDHYHRQVLASLLKHGRWSSSSPGDRGVLVDIELLASDALLTLGHHLLHGRVDPETIDPGWLIERTAPDLFEELAGRQSAGEINLTAILEGLAPRYPEYQALVERLALQRALAGNGDWSVIASGPLLRPGDVDPRLAVIRQRLRHLGDLDSAVTGDEESSGPYDSALEAGVVAFQRRHGLEPDGVIGPRTLSALNTSPQERIDQLRANIERWRWLPRQLGEEHILVNIAGFDMKVRKDGETLMTQRVVVGTPFRRTPVFTGRMTYLVLNPSWEVPHRLAVQDQLPRIRADKDYLERMGFAVLQGWGGEERRIDPASVDWQVLSARNFPYRLRQAPGAENALGRVKFMFPNRHNVYLHDTPARGLFARDERAFSSGCIRIEDPGRLTRWLLSERSGIMPVERIEAILESGRETTIRLDRPLPVHLLYWTAWVDDQGRVHYRRDIYQRDQALIDALNEPFATEQGN